MPRVQACYRGAIRKWEPTIRRIGISVLWQPLAPVREVLLPGERSEFEPQFGIAPALQRVHEIVQLLLRHALG